MLFKKVNLFFDTRDVVSVSCQPVLLLPQHPQSRRHPGGDGTDHDRGEHVFNDLWLTTLRDAMRAYAASQPGVELVMVDSKEDVATQLGQVENFVTQKVDAIVIIASQHRCRRSHDESCPGCRHSPAVRQPMPSNLPEGVSYVGSDFIQAGIMQAEWIAEQFGGKGNVVIMNGDLAQEAAQKRTEGEKQVFAKFPDIQIIKEDTGNWSRDQGLALMENWLATGDQIDAVASNNDEMAIGALQAIEAAGKLGEIIVGGWMPLPMPWQEMDKGRLNVTVFQNANGQGEGGIKAAIALAKGETIDRSPGIPSNW